MHQLRTLVPKRDAQTTPGQDLLVATLEARAALGDAAGGAAAAADRGQSATARLWSPLSSREKEVLALDAEGRSNKAIAEALFLSPNTIKTHVASLLNKLSADSRSQLAAIAVRQDRYGRGGAEFVAV